VKWLIGSRRPQGSRRGKPVFYTSFQAQHADVRDREASPHTSCAVQFAPTGAAPCADPVHPSQPSPSKGHASPRPFKQALRTLFTMPSLINVWKLVSEDELLYYVWQMELRRLQDENRLYPCFWWQANNGIAGRYNERKTL